MEKQVVFYSGPGLGLSGIIEMLPGDAAQQSRPGIVLCHGPGGVKHYLMPQVSQRLARAGYIVLRFDYRGSGDSEGVRGRLIPLEQVEDIRNAVTFLRQQEHVAADRIGLWGAATGGANASYVAAIDSRVRCTVGVNAIGDLGRWLRSIRRYWEWVRLQEELAEDRVRRVMTGSSRVVDRHRIILQDPSSEKYWVEHRAGDLKSTQQQVLLESAEALISFRPETVVSGISPRAVMWICAGKDALVPVDESRSLYRNAGEPKKLVVLEEFEHHALHYGDGFESMMACTTQWFDAHLRGG